MARNVHQQLYDRFGEAVCGRSDDAGVRITSFYEPLAGPGTPVAPTTVKKNEDERLPAQLFEDRWIEGARTRVAWLDQYQSQANRCEIALAEEVERGALELPHIVLTAQVDGQVLPMTNLHAPHRSRDAYFRDAQDAAGTSFDDTVLGKALRDVHPLDMRPYLEGVPSDLVFGVWDSHRKRRIQTRVPRVYASEMIGVDPLEGTKAAGRRDEWLFPGDRVVLTKDGSWQPAEGEGAKGTVQPSKIGHGSIPPTPSLGPVVVTSIVRHANVAGAGLQALRFGDAGEEYTRAARVLLAALALLADRLAFATAGLRLRSGCDLVLVGERVEWVRRGRDGVAGTEPLDLPGPEQALRFFEFALDRARKAGLVWDGAAVELVPKPQLAAAIRRSFTFTGIGEVEV
ncbi:type I-U CRISPR-associated RAMP protein Csb1/Cas7u [Kitasatospora sp. NPDC058046]|uniref:type I-G CRISPR-associated RAMP protein Csb1/Cas7g n=1 Tax=Kitasatospora sp. NPDC058046 TaxID=3346312 RepID=UPI0036DB94FD